MNKEQALNKLKQYCDYQDRCHKEVRTKLLKMKIYGDDLEEIIAELIQQNYLNEERYARSYVRGKFRMKSWGRNKIRSGLKQNNISDYLILKSFEEIEPKEYKEGLQNLIFKAQSKVKGLKPYQKRVKIIRMMMMKGFEYGEIVQAMDENLH